MAGQNGQENGQNGHSIAHNNSAADTSSMPATAARSGAEAAYAMPAIEVRCIILRVNESHPRPGPQNGQGDALPPDLAVRAHMFSSRP